MDRNLHTQLMKALLQVPLAQTYDGRTALIGDIPGTLSIQRSSKVDFADLTLIINQLANLRLKTGEWALSIFLDNAIMSVYGLDLESELETLKQRFEASMSAPSKTQHIANQPLPDAHIPSLASITQLPDRVEFQNDQAFAVIIGIANYPNVSQLSDVVLKDARDIRSLLRSPEYCGFLTSNVKLLSDQKATAKAIRDGLEWLAKAATPESTAIVFFSGHGMRMQLDSQTIHYLIPYDYNPVDIDNTAISGDELTRLLKAIKTQRLLVILDCCHAAGTGETKTIETIKVADKEFKSGLDEQYLDQLAKGAGRVIMASSRSDEPSYILSDMDNSLFTHYLLEALRGKAFDRGDGLIHVFDVFEYVSEKVPTQHSQHPVLKAELETNFPIALYQGGLTDVGASKIISPPLYTCLHQAKSSGCRLWYLHPKDPFSSKGPVNANTPCPICGCTGCLQKV